MPQQTVNGAFAIEGAWAGLWQLLFGVPFLGAKLHLFQSTFSPTPQSVAADFAANEANFAGYAPQTLNYSTIGYDALGNPTALTNRVFFQVTGGGAVNTIGGCWIEYEGVGSSSSSGGIIEPPETATAVEYYEFQTPIPMTTALQFLGVVIGVQAPNLPGYCIVDN